MLLVFMVVCLWLGCFQSCFKGVACLLVLVVCYDCLLGLLGCCFDCFGLLVL